MNLWKKLKTKIYLLEARWEIKKALKSLKIPEEMLNNQEHQKKMKMEKSNHQ